MKKSFFVLFFFAFIACSVFAKGNPDAYGYEGTPPVSGLIIFSRIIIVMILGIVGGLIVFSVTKKKKK